MSLTIREKVQAIRDAMDKAGAMLTTSQAASLVYLYKPWDPYAVDTAGDVVAAHYVVTDRRRFNDAVYECRQEHDAQVHYTPDMVPALWARLDVDHEGTLEDPIPYYTGMEIFEGKYYVENGAVYFCSRSSGQPLYHNLANLINVYVTLV